MVGKFLLYKNVVYQIQISELLTTEYNLVVSTYMDLRVSSIDIISQPIPGRRLTFRHKAIIPTKKLLGAPWCTLFYFWQIAIIF